MSFEIVGVRLVAEDAPRYMSAMAQADKATLGFGDSSARTFKQMPGLADMAVGALQRVGTIAVDAFMQAGRAAVGFFKDSISAAGDFESGMNSFAAVAGGALEESGLELKDFRDQFIAIGKELPVSTAEVQKAAIEMVKGGIEPATIAAGGLKQIIQFAAAADLDLAEASTIAAKALGGWTAITATAEEKAAFLAHSTDLLSKAANASTVNVDDLALGLYNVQGTAKLAGVSFDETVTTLAQLAPSFASSADAGTSFKTFLSSLQPKTKPATEAMRALNLVTKDGQSVFYDAQGQFIGMAEASGILHEATKDLTEAQRIQMLTQIFGQDGIRVAAVLAEQGAAGYDAMTASLQKQSGVADMAAEKQAGFNTAMDNAKGSFEALQITIGSFLLPMLTTLFNDYISPGINQITAFAESFFKMVPAIMASDDPFQTFLNALKIAAPGLFDVIVMVEDFKDAIVAFAAPILEVAIPALQQLWSGAQLLIGIFQSAGDESSTLGGMLNDLSATWDNLRGVIDDVMAAYEEIAAAVLPVVQKFVEEHGDEISAFFQKTYTQIMEIINTAIDLYQAIVPPVLTFIANFIANHGDQIVSYLDAAWRLISSIIDAALTLISGILKAALQVIQGDWEGAWQTIQETGEQVVLDILEAISAGLDLIKAAFDLTIDAIIDIWDALIGDSFGIGSDIIHGIVEGVKASADQLYDLLSDIANDALQAAKDALGIGSPSKVFAKEVGAPVIRGVQVGMAAQMPSLLNQVSAIASPMLAAMRGQGMGSSATYNQQRTANITYNTQYAPPPAQSYALANALAGGS